MDLEALLRWLHMIGAVVLLGTGVGIAFFMLMAHRSGDAAVIAAVGRMVVVADALFTATAAVAQPITGYWLARRIGWSFAEGWLLLSILLYVVTGLFWLPVVWLQMRLRDIAAQAARSRQPLPDRYFRLFRVWFACGIPAFCSVAVILWLMTNRPTIALP
jgi:uncharacterized membrane protein